MTQKIRYTKFADRIDIDEVYAELGFEPDEQDHRGNDIGQCILPYGLHANGDTTGKFAIHRDKKVYNCWVCGGGSLLDLTMTIKGLSDDEATEWLYKYTKPVEERGEEFMERISSLMNPEKVAPTTQPFYNERVLDKWLTVDHSWFEERGITQWTAEYFKLGFNEKNRKYAPKKNGVPIDEPFVGPAIILPHFFGMKLMGWQIRWLTDDRPKWANKYDNTGDFPKSYTVWGYDFAIKTQRQPVVVESVPTALALISLGYPAIATFGASINEAQVKLLRVFQKGIILAPDKGIGEEKYWELAGKLRRYVPVGWIEPPDELEEKEDLGDLVSTPELIHNSIEETKWLFRNIKK